MPFLLPTVSAVVLRQVVRRVIPVEGCLLDVARPTVLVVTPDDHLRNAVARIAVANGYRVMTAQHGGHAMLACLQGTRVDLLATDLSMPDLSGPALAERIRRLCPDLATVYFANCGTSECEGILVRPFTEDDLLAAFASRCASAALNAPLSAS